MSKYPSLTQVLESNLTDQWLKVSGFYRFSIYDNVNSLMTDNDVSTTLFFLKAKSLSSECGSLDFNDVKVFLEPVDSDNINNLSGERPLGELNFYQPNDVTLLINLKVDVFNRLISLLMDNLDNLSLGFSIPDWTDKTCKILPIIQYKLFYQLENS